MARLSASWFVLLVACALAACAGSAGRRAAPQPVLGAARSSPAQQLVARLPQDATRCVVVQPARAPKSLHAAIAPLSQAGAAVWSVPLDVLAYARAERVLAHGQRGVLELYRFADAQPAAIQRALQQVHGNGLSWRSDAAPAVQEDCAEITATFLDAHTVELRRAFRELPSAPAPGVRCAALLAEQPAALELASHVLSHDRQGLRESNHVLLLSESALLRSQRHRYTDAARAAQAARQVRASEHDSRQTAPLPRQARVQLRGAWLEQRSRIRLFELAGAARARDGAVPPAGLSRSAAVALDERDAQAVEALANQLLDGYGRGAGQGAAMSPEQLDALLTRARAHAPAHDGLLQRQYELRMEVLGAPLRRSSWPSTPWLRPRAMAARGRWRSDVPWPRPHQSACPRRWPPRSRCARQTRSKRHESCRRQVRKGALTRRRKRRA